MLRRIFALVFLCLVTLTVCGLITACSKDSIIGVYNRMLQTMGDNILSQDLHGERIFGVDTYAGTYKVTLENASIRERLFGNTSVERTDGYHFVISADFDAEEGSAALELQQDGEDPRTLFEGSGHFDAEVDLGPGSGYFILDTSAYTGDIRLSIK